MFPMRDVDRLALSGQKSNNNRLRSSKGNRRRYSTSLEGKEEDFRCGRGVREDDDDDDSDWPSQE